MAYRYSCAHSRGVHGIHLHAHPLAHSTTRTVRLVACSPLSCSSFAYPHASCVMRRASSSSSPSFISSASSLSARVGSSDKKRRRLSGECTLRNNDASISRDSQIWIPMVFLITIAIATCYADRSNISVAAISMAKELEWSKTTEGVVLSAFFVGYAGTQLVGGRAADVAGGKRVLAVGVAAWSIATALTPLCARGGIGTLLFIRCALGAGEGVAFPAAHSLIARHVPMRRRSVAVAAITSASYVGAAAAFLLTPTIIESSGWPAAFYGFAAAALVWIPAWLPLDLPPPNKPSESPSLPQSTSAIWRLARRKEVWAIMAAQYGQSVGLYGLLSWLPTYYDDVYDIPLSNLPALTVAPYILQGVVGVGAGWFADRLISGGVRNRDVRVLLQSIGMLGPATALLFVASAELPAESAAIAIDIGLGLSALTLGGVSVNHLDISPRNAGSVFALGNTCATLGGLVAVPAIGRILDNTHDWSLVFGLISAHFVVGVVAYVAWCGGERVDD